MPTAVAVSGNAALAAQVIAHPNLQGMTQGISFATNAALQPLPSLLARGLTPQDMIRVNAARPTFCTLEPGESLYYQGDDCHNIYLLLDGWAFRHQILEDGRRQILDFALPGVVFGLPGTGIMTHSLETLTACTFSVFTRERLFDLMRDVPVLGFRLLEIMADAEARAFEHLTSVGRRTAKERVAHLLLELVMRARGTNAALRETTMTLPLMLPHIADALGLTSETVCRALSSMRKDRMVILRGQKLDILDLKRLATAAGVDMTQDIKRSRTEPSLRIAS
ncbi:Crp/Fnr family transcriptional regulator [Dongia sp.]|uniref:Crp/Fnr family transcriptional regulator n=1 Tax=Dongia sp. TaxID=1977262 RepID=UPI0035AF6636